MSPADHLYQQKDDAYFSRARKEIAPLLNKEGKLRALEVGCSQGQTLAWLKQEGYCEWVAGVEPFSQPDNNALAFIDSFSTANIEEKLFHGRFDYTDDGILDRTHLRFFTLASAKKLAEASGARMEAYLTTGLERPQKKLLGKLGLEGLLATQFILCAQKPY